MNPANKKLFAFVYRLLILLMGVEIFLVYRETPLRMFFLFLLFFFLLGNDHYRRIFFFQKIRYGRAHGYGFIISLVISMLTGLSVAYFNYLHFFVYGYILFFDISLLNKKSQKYMIILFFFLYDKMWIHHTFEENVEIFTLDYSRMFTLRFWELNGINFLISQVVLFTLFTAFIFGRAYTVENEKAELLLKELASANRKLWRYSRQAEELAVEKERTQISEELHDTVGNTLTATILHLDIAQKTFSSSPEKTLECVGNSIKNLREVMAQVRNTAYTLKRNREITDIEEAIETNINRMAYMKTVEYSLAVNPEVKKIKKPKIYRVIFMNVQESVTNGINHGMADYFKISVDIEDKKIIVRVSDNGKGCPEVKEGTGLCYMRKRTEEIHGYFSYYSTPEEGFTTISVIPISEE